MENKFWRLFQDWNIFINLNQVVQVFTNGKTYLEIKMTNDLFYGIHV